MKVKKNDTVVVITGKDVKKTGKVLAVMPKANKVVVEGVNVQSKTRKARSAQETSQIIKREGAIDASNVLVICPKCNKATRVAHAEIEGKKVRVCKKCGASLDVQAVKEVKKTTAKKAVKEATETAATEAPKKTTTRKKKTETEATAEVKEVKKASTRKTAVKKEEAAEAENA